MSFACLVLLMTGATPGPLDAFAANYALVRVDLDYTFVVGSADGSILRDLYSNQSGEGHALRVSEAGETKVLGHWACDGRTELYRFSSPPEVGAAEAISAQPSSGGPYSHMTNSMYVPPTETLYDGVTLIGHRRSEHFLGEGSILYAWTYEPPAMLMRARGPFFWLEEWPFPQLLRQKYAHLTPRLETKSLGGRATEVELYGTLHPVTQNWDNLAEVAYDPSLSYIPRHVRLVAFSDVQPSFVSEVFLLNAERCAAGGFIPTEWYSVMYQVERLRSHYPNYDDETELRPSGELMVGHFQVTRMTDRQAPVALTELTGVKAIGVHGQLVTLRTPPASLTMADVRAKLGRNLTNPPPRTMLPTLDVDEMRKYDTPRAHSWHSWLLIALFPVILLVLVLWRRRGPFTHHPRHAILSAAGSGTNCRRLYITIYS